MGARAYRYLSLYKPSPGCLIEVGSERGEGSTAWLADYSKRHGLRFYTADIDPEAHGRAREITAGARLTTGVELLKRVGSVSVAYLDGYDWIPPWATVEEWVNLQRSRYRQLGIDHSNEACEAVHLEEAELVARKATDRCVVICDDTFRDDGRWRGKGALAVPYLQAEGFEIVDHQPSGQHSLGCVLLRR